MGRHPSVRGQPPCRNGQRPASGDHADADQEPQTACNTAHVTLASGATDAGRMVMVVVVTDESRVQAVLEPVYKIVSRQIGIVTLSDVQVSRPDHF